MVSEIQLYLIVNACGSFPSVHSFFHPVLPEIVKSIPLEQSISCNDVRIHFASSTPLSCPSLYIKYYNVSIFRFENHTHVPDNLQPIHIPTLNTHSYSRTTPKDTTSDLLCAGRITLCDAQIQIQHSNHKWDVLRTKCSAR